METIKTEVDVTRFISDDSKNLHSIRNWLTEHVGAPLNDTKVCPEGHGWKICFNSSVDAKTGYYKYKVFISFDRDDEAIMFKLSWM